MRCRRCSVIGADDIPTGRLADPPLTTVCFDVHEAGRRRAQAVLASLSGRAAGLAFTPLEPDLIQRAST